MPAATLWDSFVAVAVVHTRQRAMPVAMLAIKKDKLMEFFSFLSENGTPLDGFGPPELR